MTFLKHTAYALMLALFMLFGGALTTVSADDNEMETEKEVEIEKEDGETEMEVEKKMKVERPWTDAQLRKSFVKGYGVKYKVVTREANQPEQVVFLQPEIVSASDRNYRIKLSRFSAEGKLIGQPMEMDRTWNQYFIDLDNFDDTNTVVSEKKIRVSAGEYNTKVYKTTVKQGNVCCITKTYYFAKEEPGLLVKMTTEGDLGGKKSFSSFELEKEIEIDND